LLRLLGLFACGGLRYVVTLVDLPRLPCCFTVVIVALFVRWLRFVLVVAVVLRCLRWLFGYVVDIARYRYYLRWVGCCVWFGYVGCLRYVCCVCYVCGFYVWLLFLLPVDCYVVVLYYMVVVRCSVYVYVCVVTLVDCYVVVVVDVVLRLLLRLFVTRCLTLFGCLCVGFI